MDLKRKGQHLFSSTQKKIKHTRDVALPSLVSIPMGYRGANLVDQTNSIKPGQMVGVQRLVVRNKSADIPMPTYLQAKQPTLVNRSIAQNDLNSKLHKINLPQQYKDMLGDDMEALQQFARRKQKKENAIQELIKSGKIQKIKLPKENFNQSIPEKITLTEDGKLRDESGGVIKQQEQQTTLKINQTRKKEEKIRAVIKRQKMLKEAINDRGKFFDRHLSATLMVNKRQKQKILALNFIEKGSISANLELRQQMDEQQQLNQNTNSTEDIENPHLQDTQSNQYKNSQSLSQQLIIRIYIYIIRGFKRVSVKIKHYDPIPNIEWWDQDILPQQQGNYIPVRISGDQGAEGNKHPATAHTIEEIQQNIQFLQDYQPSPQDLRLERITHYIEHPEPFKVSDIVQNRERAVLPTYLTKQEKKRLVSRRRAEIEKDKQNRIRLGLQEPDAPKITLNNMLRILGEEAVIDPSKAEKQVKKQIQERYDKHLKANDSRKLTKELKAEKTRKRWEKDAAQEVRMAVFRIDYMNDPQVRFKVTVNAQQVGLQGVCLVCKQHSVPSLVVVEGGPKGIKFYKKVLLNRIRWDQMKSDNPNQTFGCALIWEGIQKQHSFNRWRIIDMKSEADGRLVLAEKGLEHFWDLAMKHI